MSPSRELKALDLFSGIGGFRAGTVGLDCPIQFVAYSELDKYPAQCYAAMFGDDEVNLGDIKLITRRSEEKFDLGFLKPESWRTDQICQAIPEHDILFAGFPCQAFSKMGKEGGVNDVLGRGNLLFDIVEILRVKRPKFFVLENVDGFATHEEGRLLRKSEEMLATLGYSTCAWRLNAADYGVPQNRNRVFIVGKHDVSQMLLTPTKVSRNGYASTVHRILERKVHNRYYLSEQIKPTILSNGTGGWSAKAAINQSPARPLCKTMHKMHRASQDNYYSDSYIHGKWSEDLGVVIQGKSGSDRIRRITPKEALRIQGFSEDLVDKAIASGLSDTRLYMAAGNAVPPPLVRSVLLAILPP